MVNEMNMIVLKMYVWCYKEWNFDGMFGEVVNRSVYSNALTWCSEGS